jgi:hypothetical protein
LTAHDIIHSNACFAYLNATSAISEQAERNNPSNFPYEPIFRSIRDAAPWWKKVFARQDSYSGGKNLNPGMKDAGAVILRKRFDIAGIRPKGPKLLTRLDQHAVYF